MLQNFNTFGPIYRYVSQDNRTDISFYTVSNTVKSAMKENVRIRIDKLIPIMARSLLFVLNREKIGYYESVNIINPEDAAILFKAEGLYPKRLKVEAWTSYRDYRNRKYGVLLKYVLLLSSTYIISVQIKNWHNDENKSPLINTKRIFQ